VRIFAKFLREHGYTTKDRFTLHTLGGRVTCVLEHEAGRAAQITVDMGRARFDDFDSIDVDGKRIEVTSVSVGNPHCVVIVPDLTKVDVRGLGPKIENHKRSRIARTYSSRKSSRATRRRSRSGNAAPAIRSRRVPRAALSQLPAIARDSRIGT
jgi:hypothetical protein